MELLFMFVLLRGAVGRILSPSPPLPPALRLIPSCKRGGSEQPFTCSALRGLRRSGFSPAPCPPLGTDVLPCLEGAGMCQGLLPCWADSANLPPHLCLPPKWHLKPPAARLSGWVTAQEPAAKQGRCSSLAPRPAVLPARLGTHRVPHNSPPQSLGASKLKMDPLCSESLPDAAPCQGLVRGEQFCPALPGHPGWHREHLSGGRTTLPSASSCRSRAEVRHFVLISPSKPMKQKFPHGKPLIFECARMCWKPSQWKIPNQPHSTLANLVKPLTREHLSAAVVPALLSGWKSCGMHRAEAAALASPHNWGGQGRCSQGLVSCCASFAPLFLLKCMSRWFHTTVLGNAGSP